MKTTFTILLFGLLLCGCTKKQATNNYPKESLAFAGYTRPEAALESWAWAMTKGDKTVMLQSLTPEAQIKWQKILAGMTDAELKAQAAEGVAKIQGYIVQKREVVSDDEVVLHITMMGSDQVQKYDMKKIGSEWRFAEIKKD